MKFQLIFFNGCPNHLPAVDLLNEVGIAFEAVCQDDLDDDHPLKNYSSPTLLMGQSIVFGTMATGGGCSMALPTKEELISMTGL